MYLCAATLLGAGLVLGLLGIGNHELWTADEPRVAGIAREMWRTGAWVVPRLNGVPFLEQPPLFYWAQAIVFSLAGEASAGLARLVPAFFSLLAVGLTFLLGLRFFGSFASLLSGLALLTTYAFVHRSHWLVVDSALLCGVCGVIACFAHAEHTESGRRALWMAGVSAFLVVAFFSKGVIGIGMPALAILCYLLWQRRLTEFLVPLLLSGLPVVALAALWLWRVWAVEGADALHEFLVDNQLGRFFPDALDFGPAHLRAPYYYFWVAPQHFLPWSPLALLAIYSARRHWKALAAPDRAGVQLLVCVLLPNLIMLSLAGTKRALYLLPLAPAVALLAGWWMASDLARSRAEHALESAWRMIAMAFAVLVPGAPLVLGAPHAWGWLGVSAAMAAAAIALELAPRSDARISWSGPLFLVSAAWACALFAVPPIVDGSKNLEPVARELDGVVPAGAQLCALNPSETLRGLIAFYTDRSLCIPDDVEQLRQFAARGEPLWLIVEGRDALTPLQRIESAGVAHRVVSEIERDDRVYFLLQLGSLPPAASGRESRPG